MKKLIWLCLLAVLLALQASPSLAAIALVANTKTTPVSSNGGTTPNIDDSTANFIVISVTGGFSATPTVSDSSTNIWNLASSRADSGSNFKTWLYFCAPCTVSATHNYSVSGFGTTMTIAAFSGVSVTPWDFGILATNGNGGSTTIQAGSVTPNNANSLVISALGTVNNTAGVSINSGFTQTDYSAFNSGVNYGNALGYLVQGSAAPVNPTWTVTGSSLFLSSINTAFKDSGVASVAASSKINAYPELTANTDASASAGKINAYPVLMANTVSEMSSGKIVTYIVLAPVPSGFVHSFPP